MLCEKEYLMPTDTTLGASNFDILALHSEHPSADVV
jgi:hypothetical protein